ncbi:phosphoenolpyruvate carboxykinase (ATP) [Candidatus Bipolaricaulota bacterium]|nr:phosphoenolpyruvate carboxykinase (ATP) [Candidatus Bipolaricaulota bacterium]
MDASRAVDRALGAHPDVWENRGRRELIAEVIRRREALVSASGALATWTPSESTGRRPQDTYIVDRPEIHAAVDWRSPYCIPLSPDTFEMILQDALGTLRRKPRLYVAERALGADPGYALVVRTVTDRALTALFADNMFRPVPPGAEASAFADRPFLLLALPYDKLDPGTYEGRLRFDPEKKRAADLAVVMDFALRVGIVYGSAYLGSVKKLMFTVMNFLLPPLGVLPLHGSANVGPGGDTALFLGLSGTGKTSLSADPERILIGDDEHGWSEGGVFNFEWGCYAKMIDLHPDKEPDIYWAVMHDADPLEHGAIVENAMIYPDGRFDFHDRRLTENSRASYPLSFIRNADPGGRAGHPTAVIFLTADANGVLPPIARLEPDQAMLWFLMGYTSKLAGTETGVVEPQSTFSRFFGAPFMPRLPEVYTEMLGAFLDRYRTRAYLVNTGWSGGAYGEGARIDIRLTRRMVRAALSGELEEVDFWEDRRFHLWVPEACPGVPPEILRPEDTWRDKGAYAARADRLAQEFAREFEGAFSGMGISPGVAAQCPGRR